MSNYLHGARTSSSAQPVQTSIFDNDSGVDNIPYRPIDHLTPEAEAVLTAGRNLWKYYHQIVGNASERCKTPTLGNVGNYNPNASYYDIRLHFQGTKITKSGKEQMNTESNDPTYTSLLATLRTAMKQLAKQIEPKVYQYGS